MASDEVVIEKNDVELKHLGFVREIALKTLVCVSNLYESAKKNSGSLKSAVGTVESAVTAAVGPVYDKFKGVPDVVLVFADKKVDIAVNKFDEQAPPLAKQVASKAHSLLQTTSEVTQDLVREVQVGGPTAAIKYASATYKQPVLNQAAKVWYEANKIAPFHAVAQVTLPTGAYFSSKYNKLVSDLAGKGYAVFDYLPLVPVEELTKAYKQIQGKERVTNEDTDSD